MLGFAKQITQWSPSSPWTGSSPCLFRVTYMDFRWWNNHEIQKRERPHRRAVNQKKRRVTNRNTNTDVKSAVGFHVTRAWFFGSNKNLGGGFKYFIFSPLFGEDSHFDGSHIFQMGWWKTTNQQSHEMNSGGTRKVGLVSFGPPPSLRMDMLPSKR